MLQNRNDDNLHGGIKADKCRCGYPARIRYRIPVTWVECKNKCGMRTGYFPDINEQADPDARNKAVEAWNRMVSKDG